MLWSTFRRQDGAGNVCTAFRLLCKRLLLVIRDWKWLSERVDEWWNAVEIQRRRFICRLQTARLLEHRVRRMLIWLGLPVIVEHRRRLWGTRRTSVHVGVAHGVRRVRRVLLRGGAVWHACPRVEFPRRYLRRGGVAGIGGAPVTLWSARTRRVLMTKWCVAGVAGCAWRRDCAIIARRRGALCGVRERRVQRVTRDGGVRRRSVRGAWELTGLRHLDCFLPCDAAACALTS